MQSRPSLLALALAVLAGCGAFNGLEVDIDRIEPAAATGLAPVAVQIDGAFAIDITSDLDDGELDIAAVGVLIDDIPLTDVTWQSDQRIDGTIPAGLAPGLHDIVVTIGARRGVLPGGFAITGASLVSTLTIPPMIGRDTSFTVTMNVTNVGTIAATAVAPSVLNTLGTGSAMLTTPAIGGASLDAGASTTFTWTYTAQTVGTIAFTGNATATDELTALVIASPVSMSNAADIVEVATIIADPLGDGTSFAYVVGYNGFVYLGPNQTGNRTARMLPDFTFLLSNMTLTFARDVSSNSSSNATATTYTSIGYTGCTENTSECGPDNEAGRGYFAAGTLGGTEWLVLGGAKPNGNVEYIYMTSDTDSVVDFRYVDLANYLGAQTHGFSAAHFFNNRLYLGFPDSGGAKPYFLALETTPSAPGLDASGLDAINLAGDAFPGFATTSPAMIDSFGDLNGLLYVANQAGLFAATVTTPGPYNTNPTDWALATPSFPEWTNRVSRAPTSEADLFPADRAIPQFASFGDRLFFGRNTTTGPQLWSCDPILGSATARCEAGDWQLVAPSLVETELTQFNNTNLTSITMIVATPQWLYVGFDSANGVQVFRTSNPAAVSTADFEGLSGCSANMHPTSCQGVGGTGLGDPTDTRILDAKALTFGSVSSVWITVGGTSGALRLVMIP